MYINKKIMYLSFLKDNLIIALFLVLKGLIMLFIWLVIYVLKHFVKYAL